MEHRKMRRGSHRGLPLPELPCDVWVNILSRLPIKSILRGRFVCKAWRDLLSHPHFTKVHSHSHRPEQYPGALCFCPLGSKDYCLYADIQINGDGSDTPNPTSAIGTAAVMKLKGYHDLIPEATCNGVVCFSMCRGPDRECGYYVGNPLVDQIQDFVRVQPDPDYRWWKRRLGGLGFSLKTKRCKIVVFFSPTDPKELERNIPVRICTMGHRGGVKPTDWRNPNGGLFPRGRVWGTYAGSYLDGGLHWLVGDGPLAFIARLDLESEQYERLPTPESEDFPPPDEYRCVMVLGVSGDHLIICVYLRVHCYPGDTVSIWVRMKESWMKFVVMGPPLKHWQDRLRHVKVLNYGRQVEDAACGHKAADGVVLLYFLNCGDIFASTNGQSTHVRKFRGLKSFAFISLVPSLLSIRTFVG